MSASALTPTYAPLPFGRTPAPPADPPQIPVPAVNAQAVARFDALLHELNPDAPRVDAPRLQALTQWLASMPPETARDVLALRLRRVEQLRAMLADPDWDTDEPLRQRIDKLLGYMDREPGLLPHTAPVVGLLDDVLLFELAWPVFEAEAEEYRDFCAWRDSEHPAGDAGQQRAAWLRDRLAELALLRHMARVHDEHYATDVRLPERGFHVA